MFPIISYKHQNELEKLVLVNRPSFQNHNFSQIQSFQVCPSFSPFVLAMICCVVMTLDTSLLFMF